MILWRSDLEVMADDGTPSGHHDQVSRTFSTGSISITGLCATITGCHTFVPNAGKNQSAGMRPARDSRPPD